jgi:hypothetical protein
MYLHSLEIGAVFRPLERLQAVSMESSLSNGRKTALIHSKECTMYHNDTDCLCEGHIQQRCTGLSIEI